eukprot:scaffold673910_cov57-Prasinocladus_malaysianus.AAC.1
MKRIKVLQARLTSLLWLVQIIKKRAEVQAVLLSLAKTKASDKPDHLRYSVHGKHHWPLLGLSQAALALAAAAASSL